MTTSLAGQPYFLGEWTGKIRLDRKNTSGHYDQLPVTGGCHSHRLNSHSCDYAGQLVYEGRGGVATHSSVHFRKCARSQWSTVEIQCSQRSKPENQCGQRSKCRKELVKVLTLRSQL